MPSNSTIFECEEEVICYPKQCLDEWKRKKQGDKIKLLEEECYVPPAVWNQPNYHFGEYFTKRHFEKRGWDGFVWYAIGVWEPDVSKYRKGREKVEKLFKGKGLEELREHLSPEGQGEPDLFLYKCNGETMFIEVKKGKTRSPKHSFTALHALRNS